MVDSDGKACVAQAMTQEWIKPSLLQDRLVQVADLIDNLEDSSGFTLEVLKEGISIRYVWGTKMRGFRTVQNITPWQVIEKKANQNPLILAVNSLTKQASQYR